MKLPPQPKSAFTTTPSKPARKWSLSVAATLLLLSQAPLGAATLLWQGGAASATNVWDFTVTNWRDTATSQPSVFFNGSAATFDDTAVTGQITVAADVDATMTFSNASLGYLLGGPGVLSGTLTQEGAGVVTLAMDNAPLLNSIVNNAGTLLLDFPAGGSTTLAAALSNTDDSPGQLIQGGSNTVVLTGYNLDYSGTIMVTNGVLQYFDTSASLGATSSTLYVTNNGSLDFNHISAGNKPIVISGAGYEGRGVLCHSSTDSSVLNTVANLVFAGDATLGSSGRWNASGTVQGNGYKITKVGTGQVWLYAVAGETGLGDIEVKQGVFGCGYGSRLGDPAKTITVQSGATLTLWGQPDPILDKKLVLNGGTLQSGFSPSGGGANMFVGPITLNLTNTIFTASGHLRLTNTISGSGGFTKTGAQTLYLDGTNTYTGPTTVSGKGKMVLGAQSSLASKLIQVASTLDVTAPAAFTLGAGQVLGGAGTVVGGTVVIGSGATLLTGMNDNTVATLTNSGNLVFQAGGTNRVVVNKTSTIANNKVTGLASVQIGGTLAVVNIGDALAAGDAITLFEAGSRSGAGFDSITPATPGPGLAWDTSTLLADGKLRVMVGGTPPPATITAQVTGQQVSLSWPAGQGWLLQVQTNAPRTGLGSNWVDVQGSTTNAGMTFPIDPAVGSLFYRLIYR